ncbi:hypothetical protein [uncultured Polaribacter sp.]|uniref:hypothetical protein n=1 Tax=uncultured Polaribacter sp. TaxID=174711 RepID=UPI00262465BE|nr:hypothetical protein [uncultured Polaribacter sp.]
MKKTSPKLIIFSMFVLIGISCQKDKLHNRTTKKEVTTKEINSAIEIDEVNFYFENSSSMNGYLKGDNFLENMTRVIGNSKSKKLNTFFVNTDVHQTTDILNRIEKNQIKVGNIRSSDHQFIFKTAIKTALKNNLSIVVTDGIYSVKGKNPSIVSVKIEQAFEKALRENEIETVVLKMTSNFDGTYYSESCKPGHKAIKINQVRPYYIFLFGARKVINKTLEEIVIKNDLKGLEEESRFIITKDLKVNYTVLTQGEEKEGNFKQSGHKPVVKEIGDAEKFSKKGVLLKDRYLQFGIGVDYSNLSIPESYLLNTSNYSIENNTGYQVQEVKKVNELDKTGRSYKWINNQNKKGKFKYTHVLVVRAKKKLYGDLNLSLDINFPQWIINSGTDNDCSIKNNTSRTFAFHRLITGVSKAYQKVNNKRIFFKINIIVKAD